MFSIYTEIVIFILDIVIWILFYQTILSNRKNISPILYVLGFVFAGIIILLPSTYFYTSYTSLKMIILGCTNLLSSFLLTFYYEASLRHRIFTSFSFLTCCGIAELLAGYSIASYSNLFLHLNTEALFRLIEFASKFIQILMIAIINIFRNRKQQRYSWKYTMSILITPIVSLFVAVNLPSPIESNHAESIAYTISIAGLFIMNIINYVLLESLFRVKDLEQQKQQLELQHTYQVNKYSQISSAYRNTRSILHETKRHFFYIQECAGQQDYEHILQYLQTAMVNMENAYNRVNTGNLVIDSFLSNHLSIAAKESIQYETNIQISPDRIPVDDYNLSILLGNLLDNSLQECRRITPPHPRFIQVEIHTTESEFMIHVANSSRNTNEDSMKHDLEYQLFHGYGIENVKKITTNYNGSYDMLQSENVYDVIIIIPIHEKGALL